MRIFEHGLSAGREVLVILRLDVAFVRAWRTKLLDEPVRVAVGPAGVERKPGIVILQTAVIEAHHSTEDALEPRTAVRRKPHHFVLVCVCPVSQELREGCVENAKRIWQIRAADRRNVVAAAAGNKRRAILPARDPWSELRRTGTASEGMRWRHVPCDGRRNEPAAKSHAPQPEWHCEMAQKRARRTTPVLAPLKRLERRREIPDQPPEPLQHSFPRLPVEARMRQLAHGYAGLAEAVGDCLRGKAAVVLRACEAFFFRSGDQAGRPSRARRNSRGCCK